jgi:hypothetical protein
MRKILLAVAALALASTPASATGFAIYGSGWNPDAVEDALGVGTSLSFPFGESGLGLDLRGSFYQEASVDLENIGDDDSVDIRDAGLQIIPVDAALRYDFNNEGRANFYLGGGASYLFLDLDNGPNLDDEVGWLGFVGARFGDPDGLNFFLEGGYRGVEATVRAEDLRDFFDDDDDGTSGPDEEIDEDVDINLDGAILNLGLVWSF